MMMSMAPTVSFLDYDENFSDVFTRDDVRDIIELFYRYDGNFRIVGSIKQKKGKKRKMAGEHVFDPLMNEHVVSLSREVIEMTLKWKLRLGGNGVPENMKMAVAMVLTHEIQHANQTRTHDADEKFYKTRVYNKRPCERDARSFVDKNMSILSEFIGCKKQGLERNKHLRAAEEVPDIISLFDGFDRVSIHDIKEELRISGIDNPKNVERVVKDLKEKGVDISL